MSFSINASADEFLKSRHFYVLFSGGKDSLAALLWCYEHFSRSKFDVLYVEVTGNTHPLCSQYVKQVCRELNVKLIIDARRNLDFFECLRKWGVPVINLARWCLYHFKIKVFERYSDRIHVTGLTKRSRRKINISQVHLMRLSRSITVNPILEWSREQILDFIRDHGFNINPCYKIYGHSGNCMFCPYHSYQAIVLTMQDDAWRRKILDALRHCRGRIGRETYMKWLKLSKQSLLTL